MLFPLYTYDTNLIETPKRIFFKKFYTLNETPKKRKRAYGFFTLVVDGTKNAYVDHVLYNFYAIASRHFGTPHRESKDKGN